MRTIIFSSQEIKTKKTSLSVLNSFSSLREATTFVLGFSLLISSDVYTSKQIFFSQDSMPFINGKAETS